MGLLESLGQLEMQLIIETLAVSGDTNPKDHTFQSQIMVKPPLLHMRGLLLKAVPPLIQERLGYNGLGNETQITPSLKSKSRIY